MGILTIVTRDSRRPLPHMRLYYLEIIRGLDSQREFQVQVAADDYNHAEHQHWSIFRQWANRLAWEDFQRRLA